MPSHPAPEFVPRLWQLLAGVHRIATGRELTLEEARVYFREPKQLAQAVAVTGALNDPQKRMELERILEENLHGV